MEIDVKEIENILRAAKRTADCQSWGQSITFFYNEDLSDWRVKFDYKEPHDLFSIYVSTDVFPLTVCAKRAADIANDLHGLRERALKEKEERDKLVSLS